LYFKNDRAATQRCGGREWGCQQVENEQWSPRKLLAVVFDNQIAQRKNTRVSREVRRAGFPFLKTIDDFDFTLQSTLRLALLGSYLGPELVAEGRCLVLTGKTGRGKTHVAVAIAYRAIQNGFTARFITAKSPFTEWGAALHDRDLAEAIVDRILERGRLIVMDGPSYRTRHLDGLDRGPLPGSNEPARISGIGLPEYPEPPALEAAHIMRHRRAFTLLELLTAMG